LYAEMLGIAELAIVGSTTAVNPSTAAGNR
jgi:hypothetical protein